MSKSALGSPLLLLQKRDSLASWSSADNYCDSPVGEAVGTVGSDRGATNLDEMKLRRKSGRWIAGCQSDAAALRDAATAFEALAFPSQSVAYDCQTKVFNFFEAIAAGNLINSLVWRTPAQQRLDRVVVVLFGEAAPAVSMTREGPEMVER